MSVSTSMNPAIASTPRYLELVAAFPLRPLRTEADLQAATAAADRLVDRDELADDEADYLDVLGDLIAAYEEEHHPIPAPTPAQVLRVFLGKKGITQADLARDSGVLESTISAILAGRRGISKGAAVAFGRYFGVGAERFLVK